MYMPVEPGIALATLNWLLNVRLLIARAGEEDSLAWWQSNALSQDGQYILSRIYPRTAPFAGARLSIETATVVHAQMVGHRPGVTLFNLGMELDARVARCLDLRRSDGQLLVVSKLFNGPDEFSSQLTELVQLSEDEQKVIHSARNEGELLELGVIEEDEFASDEGLKQVIRCLAGAYTLSLTHQLRVPYYRIILTRVLVYNIEHRYRTY
jgi:hypothetical protein